MRYIKFRTWDFQVNQMFTVKQIHIDVMNSKKHHKTRAYMQYTGLKDKNGIEIYEGDIIYDELDNTVSLVNFINGAFVSETYIDDNEEVEPADNRCFLAERVISDYGNRLEVIGNIYENKEAII